MNKDGNISNRSIELRYRSYHKKNIILGISPKPLKFYNSVQNASKRICLIETLLMFNYKILVKIDMRTQYVPKLESCTC